MIYHFNYIRVNFFFNKKTKLPELYNLFIKNVIIEMIGTNERLLHNLIYSHSYLNIFLIDSNKKILNPDNIIYTYIYRLIID